jgi:hypothetical protein
VQHHLGHTQGQHCSSVLEAASSGTLEVPWVIHGTPHTSQSHDGYTRPEVAARGPSSIHEHHQRSTIRGAPSEEHHQRSTIRGAPSEEQRVAINQEASPLLVPIRQGTGGSTTGTNCIKHHPSGASRQTSRHRQMSQRVLQRCFSNLPDAFVVPSECCSSKALEGSAGLT